MNAPAATRLRLDAQRTTLTAESAPEVELAVGARGIADRFFRHDPPTPFEMEQAIDIVEEAITGSRLQHAERGELVTNDPLLREWVPPAARRATGCGSHATRWKRSSSAWPRRRSAIRGRWRACPPGKTPLQRC